MMKSISYLFFFIVFFIPSSVFGFGNNAPNAVDDSVTTSLNTAIDIAVMSNDSDPDGDSISIKSIPTAPSHGTAVKNGTKITYTPDSGWSGTDTFKYEIKDDAIFSKTDTATVTVTVVGSGAPLYQNQYSCGIFDDVLTTYDSLHVGDGHPAHNAHVCKSPAIAYPDGEFYTTHSNTVYCDPNACGNGSCTRNDPPPNMLDYDVYQSSKLGTAESAPSGTLTDLEYGDFNGNFNLTLAPSHTYADDTTPVMLLGDVRLTGNSNTLKLAPGDYYFNSLEFTKNNPEIILTSGGPVRIFIKNDFGVQKNGLNINKSGNADDLLIYVEGNVDFETSGNLEKFKGFLYAQGSIKIDANSANFEVTGGITAEGPIYISGNNPTFKKADAAALGYGECQMCYTDIYISGMSFNFGSCPGIGIGMFKKIEVPIEASDALSNVSVEEGHDKSIFSFSAFNTNEVRDQDGNKVRNANNSSSGFSKGAMGMDMSLFGSKVITYPLGDSAGNYGPTSDSNYQELYNYTMFSFDFCKWYESLAYVAHYDDGDKHYDVVLSQCKPDEGGGNTYETGPFDAWDTFRDIADRNISTKIVKSDFNLTIASINSSNDGTEAVEGKECTYRLYNTDTNTGLTSWVEFNASTNETQTENNINIDTANRTVYVQFKFCQKKATSPIELGTFNDCDTNATYYEYNTSTVSSDEFAIRPKAFDFNITTDSVFTADKNTNIVFKALGADLASAEEYNETENSSFSVDLNLSVPNSNCQYQSAQNSPDINFTNGIDTRDISFNHIGEYNLTIAEVDNCIDRFAGQDCDDAEVSGHWSIENDLPIENKTVQIKIIPDHFALSSELSNHHVAADGNFTYLSVDLNMSSTLELNITAESEANNTSKNYTTGCYAHATDINISLAYSPDPLTPNTLDSILYYLKEKSGATQEGNSTDIKKINISIENNIFPAGDYNGTAQLTVKLNFNRKNNEVINPFEMNVTDINVTDNNDSGNPVKDEIGINTPDRNATFLYTRAKSTKDFYDDVTENNITTPIKVEVYCDKWPASVANCPAVDLINGQTADNRWWISTAHDMTKNDGNITLTKDVGSVDSPVSITSGGIDNTIEVAAPGSSSRPVTVNITFDTGTNSWLIYNPASDILSPSPFYKVRFIGISDWAGYGKTGHVLDANASSKKNRRLNW